ncbi:unnamed protein product [Anisakis simplex]|uniref:Integrase n=1 Tax=Anisakis simplex TaxID=6269 RepID=A0A0M3K264_ANISI|nr:unnamed protein product [Anisakis simplex]
MPKKDGHIKPETLASYISKVCVFFHQSGFGKNNNPAIVSELTRVLSELGVQESARLVPNTVNGPRYAMLTSHIMLMIEMIPTARTLFPAASAVPLVYFKLPRAISSACFFMFFMPRIPS